MNLEKSSVVIFSGGLDSVGLVGFCLEHGVRTFPIFINRGQENLGKESRAVEYFDKFFKDRHSGLYNQTFKVSVSTPPEEIKKNFKSPYRHALRNLDLVTQGLRYATCLFGQGVEMEAVYVGGNSGDVASDNSEEFWRDVEVAAESGLREFNFSPKVYAPFQRMSWDKRNIISSSYASDVPLHLSWSCWKNEEKHCGECDPCRRRKEAFKLASVNDLTGYLK